MPPDQQQQTVPSSGASSMSLDVKLIPEQPVNTIGVVEAMNPPLPPVQPIPPDDSSVQPMPSKGNPVMLYVVAGILFTIAIAGAIFLFMLSQS